MSISSVSFRSSSAPTFQEMINKPQAYKAPIAAAPINTGEKKSSTGKKVAIGLITTAAIATGLVFGHRTGKLQAWGKALSEKFPALKDVPSKVMGGLDTAGKTLNKWGETAIEQGKKLWANISEKLPKFGQKAANDVNGGDVDAADISQGLQRLGEEFAEVTPDMIS